MKTQAHRWIVLAAIISVGVGASLSHVVAPGVGVEKVMLATNTPALRIFPATPGPHPRALLAHGCGGSKEMLFRFGEALAAAGFECYSVDQAGFGESPEPCSATNLLRGAQEFEHALGTVDVFLGHSMGGGVGDWSVSHAGFRPKLFIGVGAVGPLGKPRPPVLLLFARLDEFRPLFGMLLKAQTNAQVVYSPWSEHITEAYDPLLVRTAVTAACAAVGKPVPAAPTAWRWRLAGLALGIAGAVGLMFCLPELHSRLAQCRRFVVPGVLLVTLFLTLWPWVGVTPQLRRLPAWLFVLGVAWLVLAGLTRLRLPRWSLPVLTGLLTLGCLPVAFTDDNFLFGVLMCTFAVSTLLLLSAVVVGRIAARGGSRRDGDVAMAIFAGYVIGQFMPLVY